MTTTHVPYAAFSETNFRREVLSLRARNVLEAP